ncbi:hypothetical protein PHSY_005882 [Pseudozyma hubeiensis SY62]|uniref:Uncharacterized protein n=1 Tax=Pseudozyma hubeiensis (strain SY62) TaxID=1305764 RepID=R9PAB7_PSEHS|nr:hypothetical protein PHSY_005882 [Pseudozyma hubeiensis SY62]GAC98289.1 hypothetical protein PHSY_005882 [Pseudozyma hubeiensis SY62]
MLTNAKSYRSTCQSLRSRFELRCQNRLWAEYVEPKEEEKVLMCWSPLASRRVFPDLCIGSLPASRRFLQARLPEFQLEWQRRSSRAERRGRSALPTYFLGSVTVLRCDVSRSRKNVTIPCQTDVQLAANVKDRVSDGVVEEAVLRNLDQSTRRRRD